jgi:putative copper resistance protein D
MHQTAGYGLLLIGILTLIDRITLWRYPVLRISVGSLWMVMGLFLFVRADPEGWPMGGEGFLSSWTMPTAEEWLQHKVLSLIPLLIGIYTVLPVGAARSNRNWNYGLGAAALFGVIGLLSHQHRDHPGMDIVNTQHRWFAVTALSTAVSLILETWQRWDWERKSMLYPTCVILLGLQLLFYVE